MVTANKYFMERAVRQLRRQAIQRVRNGSMPLVVYGNQYEGYRLGGERPNSVVLFNRVFPKQRDAFVRGRELGQTARKVTKPRRKAA